MTTTLIPVVLWTQPNCGPCVGAARALKARGIPHIKIDVKYADSARVANWRAQRLSTPIVEADGRSYAGMNVDALDSLAVSHGAAKV